MKILYVITSTETGGAEKALSALVLHLRPRHEVKVVCLNPVGSIGRALQEQGVDVTSLNSPRLPSVQTALALSRVIKAFQPDLVHAMLLRAVELCRFVRLFTPFKLVSALHFDLSRRSFWLRAADRFLSKQDSLTFAESLSTGSYLVTRQKYPKNKVYLLPNTVDRALFVKDAVKREKTRKIYGFLDQNIVFISVARLAAEKNHLLLLESFRDVYQHHKNVRLVLVGEGPERKNLEVFCEMNHLQNQVVFVGESTQVPDLLNAADVFVLVSATESLPLALLEALSVGLPCIVSNVGDMPRLVQHGKNGFVLPSAQDAQLLSCFLNELAATPHQRETMAQQSLDLAEKQLQDSNATYEKVYLELLK